MINTGYIIIAIAFVFLNGFFVVAEFAMVKLRSTRVPFLKSTMGWRGNILAKVHTQLDAYLSACQLGITLASLGLGWIGEPAFANLLTPLLHLLGVSSPKIIHIATFTFAFCIISFLHIVVGELMPKSMAIRQSEKMSLLTAIPLFSFYWLMYPAIYLLNASSNLLLKIFKLDEVHHDEQAYSSQEIKLILKSSHLHGELEKAEAEMIGKTLDFADLQVSDLMRPSDELIALDNNQPMSESLARMISYRFSRYPVYEGSINQILGVVHAKDYLGIQLEKGGIPSLASTMHPLVKIAPYDSALALLQQFKKGATQLALVYQREKLIGFITLDNLLQVILGRIKDEFHFTKKDWQALEDGSFRLKGSASMYTVEQVINASLPLYTEISLSGLIIQSLGHFPKPGERVDFELFYIIVEEIAESKIKFVRLYKTSEAKPAS